VEAFAFKQLSIVSTNITIVVYLLVHNDHTIGVTETRRSRTGHRYGNTGMKYISMRPTSLPSLTTASLKYVLLLLQFKY
jgi:hypothetical protein